jgi:hypothetical protein
MAKKPIAAWGFFVTAGLSLLAALVPMAKGEPLNAVFLGSAALFLVVGIAVLRAHGKPDNDVGPPA